MKENPIPPQLPTDLQQTQEIQNSKLKNTKSENSTQQQSNSLTSINTNSQYNCTNKPNSKTKSNTEALEAQSHGSKIKQTQLKTPQIAWSMQ